MTTQSIKDLIATKQSPDKRRVFFGEFQDYQTFLTPQGEPVVFYKGFHVTDDENVIAFIKTCKHVSERTDIKPDEVPERPVRSRQRSWNSAASPVITPAELLMRAASSASVPQAKQSNS